jgi:hypothetical protein
MKNNSKKFTNIIRSIEDAHEFDIEEEIEKYEKFTSSKQIKRTDLLDFEPSKKPAKPRDSKSIELDNNKEW